MSDLNPNASHRGAVHVQQVGKKVVSNPLNPPMQAPPCLRVPPLLGSAFPLDAVNTENSCPPLKYRLPGGKVCFHWAGSFLTSSPERCSSPRCLLKTSDIEKLEHPAHDG